MEKLPQASALFEPCELAGLQLANRLVMSPMTRGQSPNGVPTQGMVDYYRRRIEGGVGLVITEAAAIDHPASTGNIEYARFYGDALEGWTRVVDAVHEAGGKIFPQLWHAGGKRPVNAGPCPSAPLVTPSGLVAPGRVVGEPMKLRDIEDVIASYARAARNAEDLGFDGLEIHAAHGFLIDSFFWSAINLREDGYGGSIANRSRFATEVVQAIRASVSDAFPISLRVSQWKEVDYEARNVFSPDELAEWLEPICEAGVDLVHCSTRRFWIPEFEGSDLNLAGWVKRLIGRPTITVGSVGLTADVWTSFAGVDVQSSGAAGLAEVVRRLERGEFDLVAVGRAVLADPQWAIKVREGRFDELHPFRKEELAYLR